MFTDFRHAVRSLLRAPGFSLVVILTLALGLGTSASIYAISYWILFKSEPFPHKDRLVVIESVTNQGAAMPFLAPQETAAFASLKTLLPHSAISEAMTGNIAIGNEPVQAHAVMLSADTFDLFGVHVAMGRPFLPGEYAEGKNDVAIINEQFWKTRFAGDPQVLGRSIRIGDRLYRIVGITSRDSVFAPFFGNDIMVPRPTNSGASSPYFSMMTSMVGAMPEGVTREQVLAAVRGVKIDVAKPMQGFMALRRYDVAGIEALYAFWNKKVHWLLVGAVLCLFGVACLNATNLMIIRSTSRHRELSVRLALGGGRMRLFRLLAAESLILSACAGAVGLLVARAALPLMANLGAHGYANLADWPASYDAFKFMLLAAALTSVIILVVPFVRMARTSISEGLKEGGPGSGESRRIGRLRAVFVVVQTAFALVLLVGAGLMVRTLSQFERIHLGFEPRNLFAAGVYRPFQPNEPPEAYLSFVRQLGDKLRALPGVSGVAVGSTNLLGAYNMQFGDQPTVEKGDGTKIPVDHRVADPDFAKVTGLTLLQGRWLENADGKNGVVINATLARKCFGDRNPVGQILRGANKTDRWQVVGVISDVRENLRAIPTPLVYHTLSYMPAMAGQFVIRFDGPPPAAAADLIRTAIYRYDSSININQIQGFESIRGDMLSSEDMTVAVLKVLSTIAFLLAAVGLYSVVATAVERRKNEFGVRLALGATPGDIRRLVFRHAFTLIGIGLVVGIATTFAGVRYIQSLLYQTAPNDPVVLAGVVVLLLVAGLAATWLPARRAVRADLSQLMRSE